MSPELIALIVAAFLSLTGIVTLLVKFGPKRVKAKYFYQKWQELQKLCATKATWPQALISADDLLGEALKKRRFTGKNIGERLVEAQQLFTDNEAVWFAHKLRTKIDQEPTLKLKENDVKEALVGIRQALRDLRAL
jgi:hypothetical protein